ncbi:hypothetical protein RhiirC2_746367, partial [Rhizophagus irregularis]
TCKSWDFNQTVTDFPFPNLKLNDDDLKILCNEKITGQDFFDMTEEKFRSYGLKGGPAMRFAKKVQTLKEKLKCAFSSYLSLSEDENKIFKRCMEEVLGRLRTYGTLQSDSLEAMCNKYVVALLHAGIHIVMDITNKDFSMKPQYGIIGEESQ